MIQRKKRNSSKVNLTLSLIFHSSLILAVVFFAAREGMLGKKLRQITVTMVPKEKKPEPPKEKPPEPKVEPAKMAEAPKSLEAPKPQAIAPPPVADSAPSVAPVAVSLPSFQFSDGAHEVESVSDPNTIYRGLVEHTLRSRWNRPDNVEDDRYTAEVRLSINPEGLVTGYLWLKGSGNEPWDDSVRSALAQTKAISRPPPKGFPETFVVRFDVESEAVRDGIQLSSR